MYKKILSLMLFLLFAFSVMASVPWYKGTFDEARAEAAKQNKLVLIFFYSDN